jgi:hypothetical protein
MIFIENSRDRKSASSAAQLRSRHCRKVLQICITSSRRYTDPSKGLVLTALKGFFTPSAFDRNGRYSGQAADLSR